MTTIWCAGSCEEAKINLNDYVYTRKYAVMQTKTNWIAVIVAAVAGMFIGFLWYGLFFQLQWSDAVGLTGPGLTTPGEEIFKYGESVELDPVYPMLVNTVILIVLAALMSWLVGKTDSASYAGGAIVGLVVGTFVTLMSSVGNLFAMEPSTLSFIDGSYYLVLFAVMGAIVGGWRKRIT